MGEKLRTFVAIDIPAAPLREVLEELAGIGRPVKMVVEPLHLTLKFLGETRRSALDAISAAITEVCSRHAPLQFEIGGIGAFPRPERPSVVWAGVSPAEPLTALAAELDAHLKPLGFPPEQRAFHPHVTLARIKGRPPANLAEILTLYAGESFGNVRIGEVLFYESALSNAGPQYTILSTASLHGLSHPHK
jgi:RNA 2',3'-cyclic 3'-phosphodiesterase